MTGSSPGTPTAGPTDCRDQVVKVQTRREELEHYLRGVELHLEELEKSLETNVEVKEGEAATAANTMPGTR